VVVIIRGDLTCGKPFLQNIQCGILAPALTGNVVWYGEYPDEQHDPDKPPEKVHSPIVLIVKHGFDFPVNEFSQLCKDDTPLYDKRYTIAIINYIIHRCYDI